MAYDPDTHADPLLSVASPGAAQPAPAAANAALAAGAPPLAGAADDIQRPNHYQGKGGLECITVIHSWGLGYDLGTALAYVLRHARKGEPLRDLKKARQHLRMARGVLFVNRSDDGEAMPAISTVTDAFELSGLLALVVHHIFHADVALALRWLDLAIWRLESDIEAAA